MSEKEIVSCPNCGEPDLIGPISEGFMCYNCGWSFEYGKILCHGYEEIREKFRKIVLEHYHLLEETMNPLYDWIDDEMGLTDTSEEKKCH